MRILNFNRFKIGPAHMHTLRSNMLVLSSVSTAGADGRQRVPVTETNSEKKGRLIFGKKMNYNFTESTSVQMHTLTP